MEISQYFSTLFSGICLLCGASSPAQLDLCNACNDDLPYLKEGCERCAMPLATNATWPCQHCFGKSIPPNYRVFATFIYQFPINRLITALKFKRHLATATVLGHLMARRMREIYQGSTTMPDVIIPVPLHTTRLRQRGFNQALELAKIISRTLSIALDYHSCTRVQYTEPQASLAAKNRASNVEDAFAMSGKLKGNAICLIDDVYTTGGTAMALSKPLLAAGAHSIDVWCCARTP